MADYKEMYLMLARETTRAVDILIDAQLWCEEMYIRSSVSEAESSEASEAEPSESPEAEPSETPAAEPSSDPSL